MEEIKDRNTEPHWKGKAVNTEPLAFIFHILKYFTPKGKRGGNRLQYDDIKNRLEFFPDFPGGVDRPLYPDTNKPHSKSRSRLGNRICCQ